MSYSTKQTMKKNFLHGVGITNEKTKDILEYILLGLEKKEKNYYVVTPNPEILVFADKNQQFKTILNNARLALCDGIGVILAGKILGRPFVQRTTGTDLVDLLCGAVAGKPITMGFLGGRDGVAEMAAKCLIRKYPGLQVVYSGSEWHQVPSTDYGLQTTDKKGSAVDGRQKTVDILFVAYGFPKQEEWMAMHQNANIYKVAIGVGGAFDYISGRVPRAPVAMQKAGLEWLFRLFVQPWRVKRQVALVRFILLVLQERFFWKEK